MMDKTAKGASFLRRLGFALSGLAAGWRQEASFRFQVAAAVAAVAITVLLEPPRIWLWLALVVVVSGLVLAAELLNTAFEHLLDALHPEPAPLVKIAKDCAAAAVLVLSLTAMAVFLLMLAG